MTSCVGNQTNHVDESAASKDWRAAKNDAKTRYH